MKQTNRRWFLVLLGYVIAVSGCATHGMMVRSEQAASIIDGRTTKAEVEQMLGKPNGTGVDEQGRMMYVYSGGKSRAKAASFIPYVGIFAGGVVAQMSRLEITFDKNDVVVSHKFSEDTQDAGMWR